MQLILTSNSYTLSAEKFATLYWTTLLKKYWPLFFALVCTVLSMIVMGFIRNPLPFGLITPILLLFILVYSQYSFIRRLKKNPKFNHSQVLTLFHDRLEIEEESGSVRQFSLSTIYAFEPLKEDYRVQLTNDKIFWIPKSCFKSEEDQKKFEAVFAQTKG